MDEYDRPAPHEPSPEERQRPRRGLPNSGSSSRRTLWIVCGGVGCVAVIGCLGLLGLAAFIGFRAFTTDMPAAKSVANEFLDHVREEKFRDAYALTSAGFRAKQDETQFEAFVKKLETFTRHNSRSENGIRLFQDASGKRVFIQMTLSSPNNALTCTIVMVEESGGWKVDQLTIP